MVETGTLRDSRGKSHVNGVVEEGKKGEIAEAANEGGKWAGDVGVGEVEGVNGAGIGVAGDAEPGAGRIVAIVP